MTITTNSQHADTAFWMEIKLVLEPHEYHLLRKKAAQTNLNAAELVQKIVREFLGKNGEKI